MDDSHRQIAPDLVYGSGRFLNSYSKNKNYIYIGSIRLPFKVVMGRDVHLLLPSNPKFLDWEAYPTHQESWLPLWFIVLYQSRAFTEKGKSYKEQILEIAKNYDRRLISRALAFKAREFLKQYKVQKSNQKPDKTYKPFTRVLQDILLYIDLPQILIEDHDEYLSNHPLGNLVNLANSLRAGVNEDQADTVYQDCSRYLQEYVVGVESLERSYLSFLEKQTYNGDVLVFKSQDKLAYQLLKQVSESFEPVFGQLRIFISGEPNSGKSVFVYLLHRALCEMGCQVHLLRAAPDGEQVWVQEVDDSVRSSYRRKGTFTSKFAHHLANIIQNYSGKIMLVDAGGRMSAENAIISQACNTSILLTKENRTVWEDWISARNLTLLASLDSQLEGRSYIQQRGDILTGTLTGLVRGTTVPSSAIRRLARLTRVKSGTLEISTDRVLFSIRRTNDFSVITVTKSIWDITPEDIDLAQIPPITTDCVILDGEVPCWVFLLLVLHYKAAGCRWIGVADHRLEDENDTVIVFSRDDKISVGSCLNSKKYNYTIQLSEQQSNAITIQTWGNSKVRYVNISRKTGTIPYPADCRLIDHSLVADTVLVNGSVPCWIHARAAALSSISCGIFDPRIQDYIILALSTNDVSG